MDIIITLIIGLLVAGGILYSFLYFIDKVMYLFKSKFVGWLIAVLCIFGLFALLDKLLLE